MINPVNLIWLHYLGDYVLQFDKMLVKKNKSVKWLFLHALTYASVFLLFLVKYPIRPVLKFVGYTLLFHFVVDFVTSKLADHFARYQNRYLYFKTLGLDHALHLVIQIYLANKFLE